MEYLSDIYGDFYGMSDYGMSSGGMSPSKFNRGTTSVWILSRSDPQTDNYKGIWMDNETWQDTSVWYD